MRHTNSSNPGPFSEVHFRTKVRLTFGTSSDLILLCFYLERGNEASQSPLVETIHKWRHPNFWYFGPSLPLVRISRNPSVAFVRKIRAMSSSLSADVMYGWSLRGANGKYSYLVGDRLPHLRVSLFPREAHVGMQASSDFDIVYVGKQQCVRGALWSIYPNIIASV